MDVDEYSARGIALLPGLFEPKAVDSALAAIHTLFWSQCQSQGIHPDPTLDPEEALCHGLKRLFTTNPAAYLQALNQAPNLPALVGLGSAPSVVSALKRLGLGSPILATPPICYFLSEAFKLPGDHHRAPPHQDWRYIQGSLDALTMWVPLVPVGPFNGSVEVIPGSHLGGLRPTVGSRDLSVARGEYNDGDFKAVEASPGDGVVFSAFTLHRSGLNPTKGIRWALAFRYNNLEEPSFIERGMPSPYRFTPELSLQRPGWPKAKDMAAVFSGQ